MSQLITSTLLIVASLVASSPVLAQSFLENDQTAIGETESDLVVSESPIETETRFGEKEETIVSSLSFPTEYIEDPAVEYGTETVRQEGVEGTLTEVYKIILWDREEIDRISVGSETVDPMPRIIAQGTKIIWKELPTSDQGVLNYWAKLRVWATSYDGNCAGCHGLTYSGTPVKVGTCAVDPKLIPLGTNFYIPDYGICRAEDIGGGIKGNMVDLGFENVESGWWSARYTDVYLLSSAPY